MVFTTMYVMVDALAAEYVPPGRGRSASRIV